MPGSEGSQRSRLGSNYRKLLAASVVSNLGDGVGLIAYPWLATAVTRNPVLVAGVAVAQRLPWLLFTLPAGVITDRHDRRRLMVAANSVRAALTTVVAGAVLLRRGDLPQPGELVADPSVTTDVALYGVVVAAALLLGVAEILYDNSAQTIMPSLVEKADLEKANGRLWSAEMVANQFIGPPLAGFLLAAAFALPFFVDAATFALSAVLIAAIAIPARAATDLEAAPESAPRQRWTTEAAEGVRWLWHHHLLRSLAIVLGAINGLWTMAFAVLTLFAQEVLGTGPTEFALLMTGAAVGGIIGGWAGSWISSRLGEGPSLWATIIVGGASLVVSGLANAWPVVWAMLAAGSLTGTVWNVITVSLRQTIIPDHLLGRVNSVYRLFGWGAMPIGALAGGVTVALAESYGSREWALRSAIIVAGVAHLPLLAYAAPRLTSERIDRARTGDLGSR